MACCCSHNQSHTELVQRRLQQNTSSSATADRPCDCLSPKSSLCCCQQCQWFCAGQDAVAIRQARKNATEAPAAKCIWNTAYMIRSLSQRGAVTFGEYFRGKGASPIDHCWCQKTRVIAVSCGIKISAVLHLVLSQYTHLTDRQTDRQTGGQNCDSNTLRCITCSRTVKIM